MLVTSYCYCGRDIPSGTDICRACRVTAVNSIDQARTLLRAAQTWLRQEGLPFSTADIPLALRTRDELLARGGGRGGGEPLGLTSVWWMGVPGLRVWARVEEIAIRRGLPRMLFEVTAVHELGHAWLADRRVRHLSQLEEEGFCQLLEHRWLRRLPAEEARRWQQAIEQSRDPVYGAGFRLMRLREQSFGFSQLLSRVVRHAS